MKKFMDLPWCLIIYLFIFCKNFFVQRYLSRLYIIEDFFRNYPWNYIWNENESPTTTLKFHRTETIFKTKNKTTRWMYIIHYRNNSQQWVFKKSYEMYAIFQLQSETLKFVSAKLRWKKRDRKTVTNVRHRYHSIICILSIWLRMGCYYYFIINDISPLGPYYV